MICNNERHTNNIIFSITRSCDKIDLMPEKWEYVINKICLVSFFYYLCVPPNRNANSSSVEVKSLPPFTKYRMYLSNCNSTQPITDVIYVQTHQDVPGPVTKHRLTLDDGITLHWGPPVNPNGVLQYYSIVWKTNWTEMSANVSINENTFKVSCYGNFTSSTL